MATINIHYKCTTTGLLYYFPWVIIAGRDGSATLVFDNETITVRVILGLPETEELIRKLTLDLP